MATTFENIHDAEDLGRAWWERYKNDEAHDFWAEFITPASVERMHADGYRWVGAEDRDVRRLIGLGLSRSMLGKYLDFAALGDYLLDRSDVEWERHHGSTLVALNV